MKKIRNNTRRSLGIPGAVALIIKPGQEEEVSDSRYVEMSTNKLVAQWIKRGMLSIDGAAPEKAHKEVKKEKLKTASSRKDRAPAPLPDGVEEVGVFKHHVGGGWWDVYVNGIKVTTDKVRKDDAENIADEYITED